MRKRLAPLAMLFGLLTAMMLGGTAVAQAHPTAPNPHPAGFNCNNVGVNLITCSKVITVLGVNIPVDINISDNDVDVLSNNELISLEDSLNHLSIDALNDLNVDTLNDIKALSVVGSDHVQYCILTVGCLSS
jgi:hypothetical protein